MDVAPTPHPNPFLLPGLPPRPNTTPLPGLLLLRVVAFQRLRLLRDHLQAQVFAQVARQLPHDLRVNLLESLEDLCARHGDRVCDLLLAVLLDVVAEVPCGLSCGPALGREGVCC